MKPRYFDIHSHLNFPQYVADREDVIACMQKEGVWTITVGVDYATSAEAVALAEKHDGFFATIGQHPSDNRKEAFDAEKYRELIAHPKVVAVGECGFDYFRVTPEAHDEERRRQRALFEQHIELAREYDKPLMLHCRPTPNTMDAYEDTLEILNYKSHIANHKLRGNVHFFVGDTGIAKRFLNLGFTLSFTAVITFARDYDEVVRSVPLDMIMAETDAPFVAPASHRGERNEPTHVVEVVQKIAKIRGEDEERVRAQLVQNALRTFNISLDQI